MQPESVIALIFSFLIIGGVIIVYRGCDIAPRCSRWRIASGWR